MRAKKSPELFFPGLVTGSYIVTIDIVGDLKHHPPDEDPKKD
jgi:hypothetical protein